MVATSMNIRHLCYLVNVEDFAPAGPLPDSDSIISMKLQKHTPRRIDYEDQALRRHFRTMNRTVAVDERFGCGGYA